jgi:ABC-type transporter MlaC component
MIHLIFFLKEAAKDLPLQYIRREIDNRLQKTEQKKKNEKKKKHTLTQSNIHCNSQFDLSPIA